MTKNDGFLGNAYQASTLSDVGKLYSEWARTYDEELTANGYASPARTAAAMSAAVSDKSQPILDIGCGTGLSGLALQEAGFTHIDGTDFSAEMLALAEEKAIYRQLMQGSVEAPIPAAPDQYSNIAAVGIFSPGHAPASMINDVMALLPRGGCFGFSINDHGLEDSSYRESIAALANAGTATTVFEEYGDHLPGIGLNSVVIVLRKVGNDP